MKKLIILPFLFATSTFSTDVNVRGYQRSDGTYVAPHTRSAPDDFKWNNYGDPANDIEKQEIHQRDLDSDNIYNQYDYDDDNDGTPDDYEEY